MSACKLFPPITRRASTSAACPFGKVKLNPLPAPSKVKRVAFPYEAVPTPQGLPIVGTILDLIRSGGSAKIHEYCDRRHHELGPIFREKLGTTEAVVISDKFDMKKVFHNEGPAPKHLVPGPWEVYNEQRNIKRGLFFMDGQQWVNTRKILNQIFLQDDKVDIFSGHFNNVVTSVIRRWENISERSDDNVMPDLETELYNWSIESLGTMLFGRRLGFVLEKGCSNHKNKFVHYVQQIFAESAKLSMIPPKLASTLKLPVWRRFERAAGNALAMSREYTEKQIEEYRIREENGEALPDGVLKALIDGNVGHEEIVNIVADLILAAADTTSHATQWALYLLAKHPEWQEKLLSQINSVVQPGEMLADHHLEKIPYVSGIIKETLRLYPIAIFLTRILPGNIILSNYEIPAGKLIIMSQYTLGRDPKEYTEPNKFDPSRWTRGKEREPQSHSCMPFGMGSRSCVGRKVADTKMKLLLTRTVQKFVLEPANDKEVEISLRLITTPDKPIEIRFRKRQT